MIKFVRLGTVITVLNLLLSCSTINYKTQPEKLYIDVGSISASTTSLVLWFDRNSKFTQNDFNNFVNYDSLHVVFIKDLPEIWRRIGLKSKQIKISQVEIENLLKNDIPILIIYEETSKFGSRKYLHSALITALDVWKNGSYSIEILDPDKHGSKTSLDDIEQLNYVSCWMFYQ